MGPRREPPGACVKEEREKASTKDVAQQHAALRIPVLKLKDTNPIILKVAIYVGS